LNQREPFTEPSITASPDAGLSRIPPVDEKVTAPLKVKLPDAVPDMAGDDSVLLVRVSVEEIVGTATPETVGVLVKSTTSADEMDREIELTNLPITSFPAPNPDPVAVDQIAQVGTAPD
jgi:hypothetical protein